MESKGWVQGVLFEEICCSCNKWNEKESVLKPYMLFNHHYKLECTLWEDAVRGGMGRNAGARFWSIVWQEQSYLHLAASIHAS